MKTQILNSHKNLLCILWIIFVAFLSFASSADQVEQLTASDGRPRDFFAYSCAVSSDYALIGAPFENASGKVYIFKNTGENKWKEDSYLSVGSPNDEDLFGADLKIDGDYAVIGAPGHNNYKGSVHIYKLEGETWTLKQSIDLPTGSGVSAFGESVAINGPYLLVAAPYQDTSIVNGKAFLYKRSGETWNLIKTFSAPASVPDNEFAYSVAISPNYLIITSPVIHEEGSGYAYIHANNNDNWDLVSTITPPENYALYRGAISLTDSYAAFGLSLISSDSQGAVLIYRNSSGTWAQSQILKSPDSVINLFGAAISINTSTLAISDKMDNPGGAIFKYILNGDQWEFKEKYSYPGTEYFSQLGQSVSLYENEYLLAGNYTVKDATGDAYVWKMNSSYITINVDPSASGSTDPIAGTQHKVTSNVSFSIKATAESGYAFNGWEIKTGTVTIADVSSAETTATVNGVAEITANFVAIASVTIAVTPENGGSTSPAVGTITYPKGDKLAIEATPADGYFFNSWNLYTGAAIIDDPLKANTDVLVNGDCKIMALFQQITKEVTLTMAISPESGGSSKPAMGTHTIIANRYFSIQAEPTSNMHFSKWVIHGTGTILEPASSSTSALISENSTITAYFAQNSTPVTLTMASAPTNSGTTNPTAGDITVNANQPVEIQAHPASGYHFVEWSISGPGSIDGSKNSTAWVTLSSNATVTANFAANSEQANLTMAVSPADSGTSNPGTGVHQVNVGETYEIKAIPQNGYYFSKWNISGEAKISDPLLADTYIILSENATITAIFTKAEATTTLTISNSPDTGGSTNPGSGDHQVIVGKSIKLEASPNSGYYFTHWSLKGTAILSDTDSTKTTITVYKQTTITANFAETSKTATLTMQVSPENAGDTNPGIGAHTVSIGQSFNIKANAAANYHFERWKITGSGSVDHPELSETEAVLSGDAVIAAIFSVITVKVQLTLAVDPVAGGSTNPGIGVYSVPVGHRFIVEAIAAEGYYFETWQSNENIRIEDRHSEKTYVELSENSTLTALFKVKTTTVNLTLSAAPESFGTTNPGLGTHGINSGDRVKIEAIPASGYHFTKWQITSGTASIDNLTDKDTYITAETDTSITANFASSTTAVTLVMTVSPENSGFTSPGAGSHSSIFAGQPIEIQAHPASGYHFVEWSISGTGSIDGGKNTRAWVTLSSNATVTANFAANSEEANLTMAASPAAGGTTNPGAGSHQVNIGETYKIIATQNNGYYFSKWNIDGEAKITDPLLADTYISLSGSATITAVFTKAETTTTLTLSTSPDKGGSTNPGSGEHQVLVGKSIKLEASPNSGYYFTHWSLQGTAIISDTDSTKTIIKVYNQTTITANFAETVKTASLTIQVSPENAGNTNPGIGAHIVPTGQSFALKANAAESYYFERWEITGSGSIDHPELSETEAVLSGDSVITAVFSEISSKVQLILAVDPAAGGSTNPGVGFYNLPIGQKFSVEAIAADGYYFDSWQSDENIRIEDRYSEKTYVELSGDSTLVAVFEEKTTTVNLTLSAAPENSGTTNPGLGTHGINTGDRVKIEAIPSNGYHFTKWEITSGTASIDNLIDKDTYIKAETDISVTANFAASETAVTLEMKISPANSGSTSPGTGSHSSLFAGQTLEIQAFPADGYHFTSWSSEGANIYSDIAIKTLATLVDNAIITANFAANESLLTLTIINSNIDGGLTYPIPGKHSFHTGQSIKLEAAPFKNYYFVKWDLNGVGYIENDKAEITNAILTGNSTITAIFTEEAPIFLTAGSVIHIDASDYDETRKQVFATFYNRKKRQSVPNKRRFSNIIYDQENKEITGNWHCKIQLYNPKDYPKSEKLSDLLTNNPVKDLKLYGIYVRSYKQESILTDLVAFIVAPKIESISGDYTEKDDVFIVKGRYFGTKTPPVYIEYTLNDKIRYKRCKILKKESLRYINSKGDENKSCMKIWASDKVDEEAVGYSQISVAYPKLRKEAVPTGYIVLKNPFGMAPGKFPATK